VSKTIDVLDSEAIGGTCNPELYSTLNQSGFIHQRNL